MLTPRFSDLLSGQVTLRYDANAPKWKAIKNIQTLSAGPIFYLSVLDYAWRLPLQCEGDLQRPCRLWFQPTGIFPPRKGHWPSEGRWGTADPRTGALSMRGSDPKGERRVWLDWLLVVFRKEKKLELRESIFKTFNVSFHFVCNWIWQSKTYTTRKLRSSWFQKY